MTKRRRTGEEGEIYTSQHWDAQVESLYRPGITSLTSQHRADRLTDVAELQSPQNKTAALAVAGTRVTRKSQGPVGLRGPW